MFYYSHYNKWLTSKSKIILMQKLQVNFIFYTLYLKYFYQLIVIFLSYFCLIYQLNKIFKNLFNKL